MRDVERWRGGERATLPSASRGKGEGMERRWWLKRKKSEADVDVFG